MIDEREIRETLCECCDGYSSESCPNFCDAFKIAYAIEELGLTEYWDGFTPASYKDEVAVRDFLEKLAKNKRRLDSYD